MDDAKGASFAPKDLFVLIPIYGSGVALVYDVGFFYGIGISYFTLFSISEHIVFSLQVLPLIIGTVSTIPLTYLSFKIGERSVDKATPPIPTGPTTVEELTKIRVAVQAYGKKSNRYLMFYGVVGIVLAVVFFLKGLLGTGAFIGFVSVIAIAGGAFPQIALQRTFMLLAYGIGVLVTSYFFGLEEAKTALRTTDTVHTIALANSDLNGRLLRTGERGVLFVDPVPRQVRFLLWVDVKGLRSVISQ